MSSSQPQATKTSESKTAISNPLFNDVLDDLCMRFIVNLPPEEYETFERLFFAIESAHWFYDDFYRATRPTLPKLALKQFAACLFQHTAFLNRFCTDVDRLTRQFQQYKQEVPTCGAALLNAKLTHVVLVRAWGPNARWGFPKGKLAKGETELECAIREVLEEIGFDMTPYVDPSSTFSIDSFAGGRYCKIFVVPNISMGTVFVTKTRKEISHIQWVPLNILPDSPKAKLTAPVKDNRGTRMLFNTYSMAPFVKRLRAWVKRQSQQTHNGQNQRQRPVSPTPASESALQSNSGGLTCPDPPLPLTTPPPKKRPPRSATSTQGTNGRISNSARSRKGANEHVRNRATFGGDAVSLSDDDRKRLFTQYVVRTDRLVAEKGLRKADDFWPVDIVTSLDFSDDQRQDAERALKEFDRSVAPSVPKTLSFDENLMHPDPLPRASSTSSSQDCQMQRSSTGLPPQGVSNDNVDKKQISYPPASFKFDRDAILAALKRAPPAS